MWILLNSLYAGYYFMFVLSSADFSKITSSNISFRNTIREPNGLDPDQDRQNVGPDLSQLRLQSLSACQKSLLHVARKELDAF